LFRDASETPLRVTFDTWTPGNTLEVEYTLTTKAAGGNPASFIGLFLAISLDNGGTWNEIRPSGVEWTNPLEGAVAGGFRGVLGSEETYNPGVSTAVTIAVPGIKSGDSVVVTFDGSIGSPLAVTGAACLADDVVTAYVFNFGTDPLGPSAFTYTGVYKTTSDGVNGAAALTGTAAIELPAPVDGNPLLIQIVKQADGDYVVAGIGDELDNEVGLIIRAREVLAAVVTQASPSALFGPLTAGP